MCSSDLRSQWISSPASLKLVHRLRARHDAILVGIGTVLHDDPELTVRLVRGRNPLRVVVDSHLKIPETSKLVATASATPTFIATTRHPDHDRARLLASRGVNILSIDADPNGRVDLRKLLKRLAKENISSVMVEGGSQIITSFLSQHLAQRIVAVIAPKILGQGTQTVGDLQITDLDQAQKISIKRISRLGADLVIDGRLR